MVALDVMNDQLINRCIGVLKGRYIDGVGFVNKPGGRYRPDAACWAILALKACEEADDGLIQKARKRLAGAQAEDGRVCVSSEHPDSYWPTPLAILAWHGSAEYEKEQLKAIKFLLEFSEIRSQDVPKKIMGHDGAIKGWSWIAKTTCWVEPTALVLIALRLAQYEKHERAQEAVSLLMDRQLPHGGWNYGNTFVFEQELRPMPMTTGISLQAICGLVAREKAAKSILYLQSQLEHVRTPFTLGWSLLGLSGWSEVPVRANGYISEILGRDEEYSRYDTVSLAVLLCACFCKNGLLSFLQQSMNTEQKK